MRSIAREERPLADLWLGRVLATGAALLVCFPLLGRGYTLVYDMVFVPDPAFSARAWGGDGSVPRAVPMDLLLALAARVLPMSLVQQALLLAVVGLAVLGAWRVSPATTIPGAAAGALAFGWGPYLAERLAMGHWSLLLGVALLPWILLSALRHDEVRARDGGPALPWGLVLLTAVGAMAAPTAGLLTGLLVAGLVCLPRFTSRDRLAVLGSVTLFNAVWALPGILAEVRVSRDPLGVDAFAVSPDTPWGGIVSLITGGGVWNQLTHPASRGLPVAVGLSLTVLLAGVAGWLVSGPRWWGGRWRPQAVVLALGGLGLFIGLASLTTPGRDLLVWTTDHVPGAGILRDAQKWVAWFVLLVSVGVGPGLEWLTRTFSRPQALFLIACGAALPVIATPDLAGGLDGRLQRAVWPADFSRAADVVNESPSAGAAVVLPWHAFRAWSWNADRTVLDPWQRLLERPTISRDDLEVHSGVVPGEDPEAAWVSAQLDGGGFTAEALRGHGIRFVVEDLTTPGRAVPDLSGTTVFDGRWVRVVDLGPAAPYTGAGGSSGAVVATDLTAVTWLLVAVGVNAYRGCRRMLCCPRGTTSGRKPL